MARLQRKPCVRVIAAYPGSRALQSVAANDNLRDTLRIGCGVKPRDPALQHRPASP